MSRKDLLIAPLFEGLLILVLAAAAWVSHSPLIFASLGPTAYELTETPERPGARPYNVVVGHLIGVLAGYFAVHLTGAWLTPAVSLTGIPFLRILACSLASALTVLLTLLAKATQPAALSTTLLVSLGTMQGWQACCCLMGAVLLMTALGQPLRRWRLAHQPHS